MSTPFDEFLTRKYTGIVIPSMPTTAAQAQIACGVYARNASIALQVWEDVPLVELMLYLARDADAADIPATLWMAQGKLLTAQSAYLAELSTELGKEEDNSGIWSLWNIIKQGLESLGEQILTDLLGELVEFYFPFVSDSFAEYLVSFLLGAIKALLDALDAFDEGSKTCAAMKEENTELLKMSRTPANYALRSDILARHDNTIQNLLATLHAGKARLLDWYDLFSRIWGTFFGNAKDNDEDTGDDTGDDSADIATWVTAMQERINGLDEWMAAVDTAYYGPPAAEEEEEEEEPSASGEAAAPDVPSVRPDSDNLPVPLPPPLPDLPGDKIGKAIMIAYYIIKYGLKLVEEYLRRKPAENVNLAELIQAIKDLQYNDEEIEIPGDVKLHLRGKMISNP